MSLLRSNLLRGLALLLLAVSLLVPGAAFGQDASPADPSPSDDQVNTVAKGLYCPVCENVPLDVCPTQACIQWRQVIREKLAEGWDEKQIQDYFVLQYGDRVLAEPPARGLNWLVYVVPPLAFLAGAYVLYRAFQSWKTPLADVPPEAVSDSEDEYIRRLEEELQKR